MNINKLSVPFLGFLQATGLIVYIGLVSLIFVYGNTWFGAEDNYYTPILFLLLFVVSAVISGLLVLGRAGYLFWEKKYKPAFTLLGWTIGWCVVYGIILAAILILNKNQIFN